MKILFVLEHYYPYIGGAETLFIQLAEALAARGWRVTVVTTRFNPRLAESENRFGVEIIRVNCRNRFLFSFLSLPAVLRAAKQADFIHTTTYNAALPAWVAAKLRRKVVVVTFHELWGRLWFRLPFLGWPARIAFFSFEKLLLWLPFDHYVAVSDFTRNALRAAGIPEKKIRKIYNGLDYAKFAAVERSVPPIFTFTYFGRLGVSKGLDLLLPAASRFLDSAEERRFRLIIPRRPAAMYERVTAWKERLDHLIKDRVELLHELPEAELWPTIASSSCVVIPSYSEGFCFVAAEAVALGLPIISSGQGALVETVGGQYVEMEAITVDALVKALESAQREEYAYKTPPSFSLADSVREYVLFYQQLGAG